MTSGEILKVTQVLKEKWVGPEETTNIAISTIYAQWETAYQLALLNEKVDKE